MNTNLLIHSEAAKYIGVSEIPGPGSNPTIIKFIDEAASWLKDDVRDIDGSIAWCGCFRGHIGLITGTGVPPAHYRAASWATWGRAVSLNPTNWFKGMTAIMSRPGGNHVTLIDHIEGDTVYCLGGNQSDKVCISPFPISRITHVRSAI